MYFARWVQKGYKFTDGYKQRRGTPITDAPFFMSDSFSIRQAYPSCSALQLAPVDRADLLSLDDRIGTRRTGSDHSVRCPRTGADVEVGDLHPDHEGAI